MVFLRHVIETSVLGNQTDQRYIRHMSNVTNQAACNQCGKPAIYLVGNVPVCLDCHYKMKMVQWMEFTQHASMLNYLDREITQSVGLPGLENQIKIPDAPIPPIHFNNQNVTISGSTVGSINLGNVHDIQVSLQAMNQAGEVALAEKLTDLTNAVLASNEIGDAAKNEVLEQIAHLTLEATKPPAERKQGTLKVIFSAVQGAATTVGSLATAWSAAEPLLQSYFHL